MRVFVTGGSGFLGSYLVHELIACGHTVSVLTRDRTAVWRLEDATADIEWIVGDLGALENWRAELEAFRPEAIAHLGWDGVANFDRDSIKQLDNIPQSARLAAAGAQAGATVFLGLGSQAEYGPKNGAIGPGAKAAPTTLYGHSKLATCSLCRHLCERAGTRFAWMRVFSTYGPADHDYWLIPDLILQLLGGKRPALTAGEQRWDFLHARDCARALRLALENDRAQGIYNLGSGSARPLRETIAFIRDRIDPSLPLGFGEVPYRSDQVMHLEADIAPLTSDLGWSPQIGLEAGLSETVEWYHEHHGQYGQGRSAQ